MAVARVHKTKDYTVMSNTHFREKEMSLKAKGLLSLMLSLPDTWDYSIAGLVTLSKDGKDSVMNALKELEEFGYLTRTRLTDEKGKFAGYDYDIFENPNAVNPPAENPNAEKPNTDKPNTENPPQSNNNPSSTKEGIPKQASKKQKANAFDAIISAYTSDAKTIELLNEWLNVRKAKRAAMTETAIQMNIAKLNSLAEESKMTVTEYLAEIICRGWAAFYPIVSYGKKDNSKTYGKNGVAIKQTEEDDLEGVF